MKSLSEIISNLSWGGQDYPAYSGYMATGTVTPPAAPPASSAPPAAPPSSGSTGAPPVASPPTTPSGVQPASPAAGAPPTSPTAPAIDPNAANLEVIRKSHELVQRLGGVDRITPAVERYNKMYDTSRDLAIKLGYVPESFDAAFAEDPATIYTHIMQEAQRVASDRRTADGTVPKEIRDYLDRTLGPVKSVLQRQMAESANRLTDNEFDSRLSAHALFKGKTINEAVKNDIYDRFVNYASQDTKTQRAILDNGDVSGLAAHFDKAVADHFAVINAYNAASVVPVAGDDGRGGGNRGGNNAAPPAVNANPFNLDDVIEGNDNATKALPSLRNFRGA